MTERSFKVEGLVLRTKVLGEADRLVTLLTFEEGKFEAVARGARKTKSKLAAGVDLFTYGRFDLHKGRTWPIITGQDPIESFHWFRDDPDLYPYGIYLSELTDRLITGEEACVDICGLLLQGWRLLGEDIDRNLLCRAFELKIADTAGYSPHLDCCLSCGAEETNAFSPRQGGLICCDCHSGDLIKVGRGSVALAKRLIESPLSQVKIIRSSVQQKRELALITAAFFAYHLDIGELKSRRLLPD